MTELFLILIGALISAIFALVKVVFDLSVEWLIVCIPLIISLLIVAVMNGWFFCDWSE